MIGVLFLQWLAYAVFYILDAVTKIAPSPYKLLQEGPIENDADDGIASNTE